jgi:c-di-GMP-related signal transduction protein
LETLDQVAHDLGHLELDVLIQRMEEEESYSMAEEQQLMTFQGLVAEKT